MHHAKRYMVLILAAVLVCLIKFSHFASEYETIGTFRGAQLEHKIWNPLIAQSVNEGKLSVTIDNNEYTNADTSMFMDENLSLMVPVTILREALNCSSHLYNETKLLVEKRTDEVAFALNDTVIDVNGKRLAIDSPMIAQNGDYYVSLKDLSEHVGYSYDWDILDNKAVAVDQSQTQTIVPAKYDLRKKGRVSKVKNQGNSGTCWAFAALSALESELLPKEQLLFSPDHMSKENSFRVSQLEGGEYTMGMAYLLSWQGPVLEKDDPFGDGKTDASLAAVKHVQEVQMIEGKDYVKIKEAVFKYGGVQTALYSTISGETSSSAFYSENSSYCYIGTEKPNHEVVIVGWDDSYPKEKFPVSVEGDGAFICQNSWGNSFGEDGIFYVSYYDTNIGSHNLVYTGVEDTDNYDAIYQSDLCGWVGQLGFEKSNIYGANVFTAAKNQIIRSAGFYATGKDTEYMVYLVKDFKEPESLNNRQKVAQGKLSNAGYYTIPFQKGITVKEGERFAVLVYLNTPDSLRPMAIEYAADEATAGVELTDGEGYISSSGRLWRNVESSSSCNLCIKAYAEDK